MFYKFLSVLGILITLFSLFIVFTAIGDFIHPEETKTKTGVLMGLITFFSLTGIGGIYLFINSSRKNKHYQDEKQERQLLGIIATQKGKVTPEEIAFNTKFTVQEARYRLDKLCNHGAGEVRVTEEGRLIYYFFGFVSDEEKQTSKNVLDM